MTTWHELAESAASCTRCDGFSPIESYGLIGDGESVALVSRDGGIDWWAAPAMDSPPVFAAILDPACGGRFALSRPCPYEVTRRYLPGTNVLETTFSTADGTVRVIDSLNQGANGPLPWAELARDIRPDSGEVPMRWRVTGGTLFHRVRPWARVRDVPLLHAGDLMVALVAERACEPKPGLGEFSGEFTAKAGQNALLTLIAADHAPLVVPSAAEVRARREASEQAWRKWCKTVPYRGEDRDLVLRSVLALKLLTYAPTGAMAAAATSSLPERIGGQRNYDYRYGWIRDTSFVLDSFIQLGLTQEVQGTLAWMLSCISATAPEIHPFYGLRGYAPDSETKMRLRGYRDSYPARDGNRAVGQPQWGVLRGPARMRMAGRGPGRRAPRPGQRGPAGPAGQPGLRYLDRAGLWDLGTRRTTAQYLLQGPGRWVALDRLLRLAEAGQVSDRDADRWKAERAAIRADDQHCWSEAKQSYAGHAGADELDASLLLLARTGFLGGRDRRFGQTIRAIRAELTAEGPLLYRFSGARDFEGAFVACSFWLTDALVRNGHAEEARKLWDDLTGYASDLGLFAEEIDPATGAFLGNMPQGLSHLALLNAAALLNGR